MSDRELLTSLGDYVPDFWRDLDCEMAVGVPEFWLRMDDALAKRGWDTTLVNCATGPNAGLFLYSASNSHDLISGVESSRNSATREVYESIIAKEGKEEG